MTHSEYLQGGGLCSLPHDSRPPYIITMRPTQLSLWNTVALPHTPPGRLCLNAAQTLQWRLIGWLRQTSVSALRCDAGRHGASVLLVIFTIIHLHGCFPSLIFRAHTTATMYQKHMRLLCRLCAAWVLGEERSLACSVTTLPFWKPSPWNYVSFYGLISLHS